MAAEVAKITARATFKTGRDNAMVATVREMIDGKFGDFVALANPTKGVKAGVEYQVELIEMKSKKGFIVTAAKEVRDEIKMVDDFNRVQVFVKKFGMPDFEESPRYTYDRTEPVHYDGIADAIRHAGASPFNKSINIPFSELQSFRTIFVTKCKAARAGNVGGEILDEPIIRLEDEVVNVYIRYSYDKDFVKCPLVSYDATTMGWEAVADELKRYYADKKIIMPEADFAAFMEGFVDVCRKREMERKKEAKKSVVKTAFTKSVKMVDGEKLVREL